MTLYVRVDNWVPENETRFKFAYFKSLVYLEIFEDVIESFITVGGMHGDINQSFSTTAK